MAHEPLPAIEKILSDLDGSLRRCLSKTVGLELDHILLVVAPTGDAVIRSNCDPGALRNVAKMLTEIADQVAGAARPH